MSDATTPAPGTMRPLPEDALPILPTRQVVLFPGTLQPLSVGRPRSQAGVQEAVRLERAIGLLLQKDAQQDEPAPDELHWVGTSAAVLRYVTTPEGAHHAIVRGAQRFRVLRFLEGWPFLVAQVEYVPDATSTDPEVQGRGLALKQRALETLQLLPQVPAEMVAAVQAIDDPAQIADVVASVLDVDTGDKQALLETFDLSQRLEKLLQVLAHRIEVLKVQRDVADRTRESIGDVQRKHLLREQLRTIQRELGEEDETAAEAEELERAVNEARMPPEVEDAARKELKRLARMPEAAGEAGIARSWLEWLTALPWGTEPEEPVDLGSARTILDEDHFGLEKIKKRILEYLAVRKLNPTGRSPILCFAGPPGVGKTSLGQSIAKATGRKFVRVSLGGVHNESEIRGHRRTYIGALPGNIIQGIRRAGSRNCVLMLDEIDKLGAGGFHGDPAAALLEVLDPEQNSTFRDAYLGVPFDLSPVMFLCTANVLDTIPGPLRDRMEIITLPGYTTREKLQIARRYLLPRQQQATGLPPEQASLTDDALLAIIEGYTREAGVRNLEREIGNVLRHAALRIAEGEATQMAVDAPDLQAILGGRRFEPEVAMRAGVPGVATGLAWTSVGGDILFIEAARTPGSGRLILTGQLGDVMKESGQTALSLVKARAGEIGIGPDVFDKSDIHIHVPAGATPKDGPSAGVAMCVALASLLMGKPARSDVAMTGEISLRGLVLPIGGVKEKVIAAQRAGITTVMLPARNQRDLEDIPADARAQMQFVWLEKIDDALQVVLAAQVAQPA